LKIYINATGPNGRGGYFTYITNLVKNLALIDHLNEYEVMCNGEIYQELIFLGDKINLTKGSSLHRFGLFRLFWMQLFLPFILALKKYEICLFPLNASPYFAKFFKLKSIVVVHSVLPWVNSSYLPYGPIRAFGKRKLKEILFNSSNSVITVSEYAKEQLLNNINLSPKNIHSIYLGVNPPKNINNNIFDKYFLYVANSALHHNHIKLLESYKYYIETFDREHQLYLVLDKIDKKNYEVIQRKIKELKISNYVKNIAPMSNTDLNNYYSNAKLYIFPSLSETFGMTTLEAMACGTPVICSKISAIPEINGDAAIYFDPHDPQDIAQKINLVLDNKTLYDSLITKGYERIKKYTWDKTARRTAILFKSLSSD
jgi:glycosyltransferase involved in cell wall biosynthesis